MILQIFQRGSQERRVWLLLGITAFFLALSSIYFQHVMLLQSCVMCIYERCAIFGILGSSIVGVLAPKTPLRYVSIVLWIYSAGQGVQFSWKHTMMQLHSSALSTCNFFITFPSWLPLDRWLPMLFQASSNCENRQWTYFSLTIPQWLLGIFFIYIVIAVIMLVAQFVRIRRSDLF